MSDTVHPLCSLALYSGTPALIGVSLGLAAFSCYWNTVSLSPPLILCTDFFNVPSPLLFCSSYSCSHLFLRVLQSKFEKGVGVVRWGLLPSPPPSFLLCYGFRRASLLLPAASRRESPASLGGLGREWRRLPSQDTFASLPSSLLPSPPSRGGEAPELEGLARRAETTSRSSRSREFPWTRRHVKIQKPSLSPGSLGHLRVFIQEKAR